MLTIDWAQPPTNGLVLCDLLDHDHEDDAAPFLFDCLISSFRSGRKCCNCSCFWAPAKEESSVNVNDQVFDQTAHISGTILF